MQRKWVASPDYRTVIQALRRARLEAGLSQREVAKRMAKHPSFINKIELIERRIDVLEYIALARAIGVCPSALLSRISAQLPDQLQV